MNYLQVVQVIVRPPKKVQNWVLCTIAAIERFGGVPRLLELAWPVATWIARSRSTVMVGT